MITTQTDESDNRDKYVYGIISSPIASNKPIRNSLKY